MLSNAASEKWGIDKGFAFFKPFGDKLNTILYHLVIYSKWVLSFFYNFAAKW
jgi:hypothetical protein